jgi:cell fate regulator YaaT (PSP1 superfamily)
MFFFFLVLWGGLGLIEGVCRLLAAKTQDELKALQLCQSKVRAKKLPMEVIDAEYQWYAFKTALFSFVVFVTFFFMAGTVVN